MLYNKNLGDVRSSSKCTHGFCTPVHRDKDFYGDANQARLGQCEHCGLAAVWKAQCLNETWYYLISAIFIAQHCYLLTHQLYLLESAGEVKWLIEDRLVVVSRNVLHGCFGKGCIQFKLGGGMRTRTRTNPVVEQYGKGSTRRKMARAFPRFPTEQNFFHFSVPFFHDMCRCKIILMPSKWYPSLMTIASRENCLASNRKARSKACCVTFFSRKFSSSSRIVLKRWTQIYVMLPTACTGLLRQPIQSLSTWVSNILVFFHMFSGEMNLGGHGYIPCSALSCRPWNKLLMREREEEEDPIESRMF